jgi:hypothetical protein
MSSISFNPMVTTGAANSFLLQTQGYVQGTFLDDPAMRYQLEGGYVSSSQDTPLFGGLPISLAVADVGANQLGPACAAAGSLAEINAWCLFNQASAGIITGSSPVPTYSSGMSVNFARPGSLLRIVVPVHSTVIDSLQAAAPNVDLYWDPTNLYLTTSSSSTYGPLPVQLEFLDVNSKVVVVSGSPTTYTWNPAGAVCVIRI